MIHRQQPDTSPIPSPCTNECQLNDQEMCTVCYRTMMDIIDWTMADETEKKEILKKCAKRKAAAQNQDQTS
jgi:predicted Fe-S protein YdhL (DUF1289 family)